MEDLINRKEFEKLAGTEGLCVSIFIPTHREGQAVLEGEDIISLKNQLKEVKNKLLDRDMVEKEADLFLAPGSELLNDKEFWTHQSDGLAVFITDNFVRVYNLPVHFEDFNYVSDSFYLKPLMPMFTGDGRFFILALELKGVEFYEATRHSITDVKISDLVPSRLEEAVGFDHEQKNLQFRTQQGGKGGATFHGQGEGNDDRKDEILKYFRVINGGLMNMLHDENAPMVAACLNYLFPIYKEVNTYNHLVEGHIPHNPSDMDTLMLHERAWEVVEPFFDKERKDKYQQFQKFQGTGKTSDNIKEILPAAFHGKIDTLFIQNRSEIWGKADIDKNEVTVFETQNISNHSLLNQAAIQTFLQGGKVYLSEKEKMPSENTEVQALYRY